MVGEELCGWRELKLRHALRRDRKAGKECDIIYECMFSRTSKRRRRQASGATWEVPWRSIATLVVTSAAAVLAC